MAWVANRNEKTPEGLHIAQDTSDIFRTSFKGLTEAQITKLNGTLEKIFNNLPED